MIGKKDTLCIFEQYRNVIKEQADDNKINAIINAIKTSALAPEVKSGLLNLLSDPEVAAKWKVGDASTINSGDSEFAKELSREKKLNSDNRSGAEMLGSGEKPSEYTDIHGNAVIPPEQNDEDEYKNCHLIADPRAREICEYNKRKVGRASVAAQGVVDPKKVLR